MRPGGGWRLLLAAVVLGVVLANARDCDGSRVDSTPGRAVVEVTS